VIDKTLFNLEKIQIAHLARLSLSDVESSSALRYVRDFSSGDGTFLVLLPFPSEITSDN
jgi:hypothetical protein